MTATVARDSRTLTPDQEPVRCTICGIGADAGSYLGPARHVVTTIYVTSTTRSPVASDHEPVCDNIAPDGRVYPFGRIVATEKIGPYTITTFETVQLDGSVKTSYTGYIAAEAMLAGQWATRTGAVCRTGYSHATLDEALAFCIAYRHAGPNTAQHIASHFVRGLRD